MRERKSLTTRDSHFAQTKERECMIDQGSSLHLIKFPSYDKSWEMDLKNSEASLSP